MQLDRDEATAFYRTLFGTKPPGYVAMAFKVPEDSIPHRDDRQHDDYKPRTRKRPDGSTERYGWVERRFVADEPEVMFDEVDDRMSADPVKVMISPALFKTSSSRRRDNIERLQAVHLDFDADGQPMNPELFQDLLRARPMLVWSGREHNFHAYIRVRDLPLEDHRRLIWAVRDKFGGDDKIAPNDLLTLPGTYNYKDPANPRKVRLLTGEDS